MIVENHEVDRESLVMKILMAAQNFPDHWQILKAVNPHKQDWQVAADCVWPQARLGLGVQRQDVRPRSQRGIGINNPRSKTLKQVGLFSIETEMAHLDLGLGPSQPRLTLEDARIVILVSQHGRLFTGFSDCCTE
jgi:hypothetical protein